MVSVVELNLGLLNFVPLVENHCCAAFISTFKVNGSIVLQFFDRFVFVAL